MFEYTYDISQRDIEGRYGHVHHAQILCILEQVRLELLKAMEQPLAALIERNLFLVITEIKIRYRRELKEGPHKITCEKAAVHGETLSLEQRIYNPKGRIAVEAYLEFKFMHGSTRCAVDPPADFIESFCRLAGGQT